MFISQNVTFISLLKLLFLYVSVNPQRWDPNCESKWPNCNINGVLEENTVCSGKSCGPKFKGCEELPPDAEFREAMLDKHNTFRNKLASGADTRGGNEAASNMMVLSYDLELEYTAICHANWCKMEHDKCRAISRYPYVGQNLASAERSDDLDGTVTNKYLRTLIQMFYQEITKGDFTNSIDSYVFDFNTGHFTALVWAKTTHIGCARSLDRSKSGALGIHLTCNYGPGGNVHGQPMYKKGRPCSSCPSGLYCNSKYDSLCGTIDESAINAGENPYRKEDKARNEVQRSCSSDTKLCFAFIFILLLLTVY